jgi:hypothetical protein
MHVRPLIPVVESCGSRGHRTRRRVLLSMIEEPGRPSPSGDVRASDAEREAAVERLRVATTEGRLTLTELTERTEAAYTATTRGELVRITADLPAAAATAAPVPATPGADREWVIAIIGDTKRQGRWRVERPLAALAVMGDVVLDLRGAEVPQGQVAIDATAVMGDVKVIGDSYAEPLRRGLRAWLRRDDHDRRAIE